jgi:hypothetical protein
MLLVLELLLLSLSLSRALCVCVCVYVYVSFSVFVSRLRQSSALPNRSSSKRRFASLQFLSRGFAYSALSSFNRLVFFALFQGLFLSILQALLYSPLHSPSRIVSILFKHYCILLFMLLQRGLYLSFKHCILLSTLSFKDSCCIYPSSIVFSSPHSPSRILVVSILQVLYSLPFNLLQGLYLSFKHCILSSSISFKDCIYPSCHRILLSTLSFTDCLYLSFKHYCILLSTTLLQGLFVCILQSIIVFSSPLSFKVLYCPLFHYSPSIKRLCA